MGNFACVPQAPGGFRSSFRRKPSLQKGQNGKKKLGSFFGTDGGQERDTSTDKILQYIPAKVVQKQENQKENLEQRFPSLFRKGRRKTVVRNLGKMIYYSKVKFRFQHCQEVNDCFLELFQSYLYFQSAASHGLTYQGLLPLKELQVRELQGCGQEEHTLHISGPLLNPLVVLCPSEAELKLWLYHLEKQIQLCGGSLAVPLLAQSGRTPSATAREELRWSLQNLPVQDWRGTQRESLGEILCVSKVKLQHLPFQEQHERLLLLYPSTLVIVSEEPGGLCFKGELPLNAIQVLFEDKDKTSFLIEGRLINSIRVSCPSYRDYQEWLYCLSTAQFHHAARAGSLPGSRGPQPSQLSSSGRGSLSSEGHTNSWASGGRVTTLTPLSQSSSQPDGHSVLPEPLSPGYAQPLHSLAQLGWPSSALPRGSSSRKCQGRGQPERSLSGLGPEIATRELLSPVYHEPYTAHGPLHTDTLLQCQGHTGPAQGHSAVPHQLSPERWQCQPLPGPCREGPTVPIYSTPGSSRRLRPRAPAQGSHLAQVCALPEEHLSPSGPAPDDVTCELSDVTCELSDVTCNLPGVTCPCHDYTELSSAGSDRSDRSYDNLWEAGGPDTPCPALCPAPCPAPCPALCPAPQVYQV